MKTLPKIIKTVKNAIQKNKIMKKMKLDLLTKRNTILFFCLTVLSGTGCYKDNPVGDHDVLWKGRILEKGTNKPVPNADIFLYEHELDGDLWGGSPRILINSYKADGEGWYQFTFNDLAKHGYDIQVVAKDYYESKKMSPNEVNGVSKMDVVLDPYAWIKFHVKNVNPQDDNDRITIDRFQPLDGRNIDTFLISEQIGNLDHEVIKRITKGGVYKILYDTLPALKAHDTTYFEIKY